MLGMWGADVYRLDAAVAKQRLSIVKHLLNRILVSRATRSLDVTIAAGDELRRW